MFIIRRQVTNYRFNQNSSWTGGEEEMKRTRERERERGGNKPPGNKA